MKRARGNEQKPLTAAAISLLFVFCPALTATAQSSDKKGKRPRLTGKGRDVKVDTDAAAGPSKAERPRKRTVRRKARRRRRRRSRYRWTGRRTRRKRTRWRRPSRAWGERHRQRRIADVTYYAGVVPGKNNPPPGGIPATTETCYMTWPGFQLTKSGSRVFFQLTTRPAALMSQTGRKITVTFPMCRIRLYNNRRRLVTRHFRTPVSWIRARRRRKDIQVTIKLRADAKPSEKWSRKGTFNFYFLEFGPYTGKLPGARGRRKRGRRKISTGGGYIRIRKK